MDLDFCKNFISKSDSSKVLKVLWVIVLLASTWGLGYYAYKNYIKLNVNPEVLVKAQYVNSRTIPFPAITLCPANFALSEFINITKFYEDLKNGTIPAEQDRKIVTAISHTCDNDLNFLKKLKNGISDPENIVDIFNKVSPQMMDILDGCSLGSDINCSMIFIRSLTNRGNCFTFNMLGYHSIFNANISADFDGYKRKNITKSWNPKAKVEYHDDDINDNKPPKWTIRKGYLSNDDWVQPFRASGLQYISMQTAHRNNEIWNFCANNFRSYRAIIHLPNEVPTFSNMFSFFSIGQFKYMRIYAEIQKLDESLKKYPPDFRKCFFEGERQLKFLKSYTKLNCELECMTNFTYKTCGCVTFWMPRTDDMNVCKFGKIDCYTEIFYKWTSSYYKDDDNKQKFPDFPCNCLPTCTRIQYKVINEMSVNWGLTSKEATISGMQIAFGDAQILETINYVTYTAENFVSDIGGLAGLFLEFSILSLFELTVKAFAAIKNFIKNRTCTKENQLNKHKISAKSRKRRNHRMHRRGRKVVVNPDVVIIDLLFGEQIQTRR